MLLLLLLLADVTPKKVLVLDVEAIGVSNDDAAAATRLIAAAAAEVEGVEVVSATDLRRLADLEAQKSAAGCTDSSCLAEMAGALGAEHVLFGSLSRLGTTTTASLSLFTAQSGRIERRSVDVSDLSHLPAALREKIPDLLGVKKEEQAPAAAASPPPLGMWLGIGGGALAVAGLAGAGVSELLVDTPSTNGSDKELAQLTGRVALGALVVGAGVGITGAVLALAAGEGS